eukprot:scaffold17467_cov65-Phaeocystis_antarctica.AAC.7
MHIRRRVESPNAGMRQLVLLAPEPRARCRKRSCRPTHRTGGHRKWVGLYPGLRQKSTLEVPSQTC